MDIKNLLDQIFTDNSLFHGVLSGFQKFTIRQIVLKNKILYQISEQRNAQVFHKNLSPQECRLFLESHLSAPTKQALLCTSKQDYQILINKKNHRTILTRPPSHQQLESHNRTKKHILTEAAPLPFLVALGIMTQTGKILPDKRDKFKQINKFLEVIAEILPHLKEKKQLTVIDFGCGKAYLTFALYHYLTAMQGYAVEMIGLDLKKDVVDLCQNLANRLGYSALKFICGDIANYQHTTALDLMISLHACDIATDIALEKAIHWQAEVILSVPCCQHELLKQIHCEPLKPLLRHGILKERFAALVTDAARAELLEISGYRTDVIEFIDHEHTPKNLLIRAVRRTQSANSKKASQEYTAFTKWLNIAPFLEKHLMG